MGKITDVALNGRERGCRKGTGCRGASETWGLHDDG